VSRRARRSLRRVDALPATLRALRARHRLSQGRLARLAGISDSTIAVAERFGAISVRSAVALARALRVARGDILPADRGAGVEG